MHGLDGCGVRTHNPRDGVVTIIAIADGEEAFFDANGDGSYDVGEPFVDLGEPFVDQNDNGRYDAGEWFLDVDDNGAWTPPNGRWDATHQDLDADRGRLHGRGRDARRRRGKLLGTRFAGIGLRRTPASRRRSRASFDVDSRDDGPPGDLATRTSLVASDLEPQLPQHGHEVRRRVLRRGRAHQGLPTPGSLSTRTSSGSSTGTGRATRAAACASQCRATGAAAPCVMKPAITTFSLRPRGGR